jgi:hypothetical protein
MDGLKETIHKPTDDILQSHFYNGWFHGHCIALCSLLMVISKQHYFIFMLDHLCGHDRQREDGLNAEKMNKSYGGNQPKMQDTYMPQEKGYLGPYLHKLHLGDTQSMVFLPSNDGPFWMSAEERENKRKDVIIQGVTVK